MFLRIFFRAYGNCELRAVLGCLFSPRARYSPPRREDARSFVYFNWYFVNPLIIDTYISFDHLP